MKQILIDTKEKSDEFLKNPRRTVGILSFGAEITISDELKTHELEELAMAAGIKNRNKRIAYIYDTACRQIDRYNEENGITCVFNENRCPDCRHSWHINGCCFHCPHQSTSGCTISNLSCRLYFCDYMIEHFKPLKLEDMAILRLLTSSQRAIIREDVFTKREISIGVLCIGSYLVFGAYSFIKILRMKNLFVKNRKN